MIKKFSSWVALLSLIMLIFAACKSELVSSTITLSSGEDVEVYEYTDQLDRYHVMYPSSFFVHRERTVGKDRSRAIWRRTLEDADNIEDYVEISIASGNGEVYPSLDDWMEGYDEDFDQDWEPTQLGNAQADVIKVETNTIYARTILGHYLEETYLIDLTYPKNDAKAAEDAELIWQVVLETFEYLP